MKAVAISEFDATPSVVNVDAPQPGEGEVLVDVEFASVNGMDLMKANGMMANMMPHEFPVTLGCDFSGSIAGVGSGVTDFAVGDAVFGLQLPMTLLRDGTFAEQTVVPAFEVAKRPEGLDAKTAAGLALAGSAAKIAIDNAALKSGETVLIGGATGGVGSLALQMAKQRGATVIATATPEQAAFVQDLGADEVVDYTGDLTAQVRALRPDGVDAVIHLAGDPMVLASLVRKGGRIVSTLGVGPDQVADLGIDANPVMTIPNPDLLPSIATPAARGDLRVPITATYGLGEVGQAFQDFGAGALGKLVIDVRQ
jgi:NADPH:quinone reductase-like Zn-dependent oxidoreductase